MTLFMFCSIALGFYVVTIFADPNSVMSVPMIIVAVGCIFQIIANGIKLLTILAAR